jgi:putative phosphoribosyl transferase
VPVGEVFQNRIDAGRPVATRLEPYRGDRPVVLGSSHAAVVVACEIARALGAPLEVPVARRIGALGR